MTCDDCDQLLAAHAVGALDADEDRRLQLHLAGCPTCRAAAAAYLRTADLLPLTLEPVQPPPALRSRLLAQVHAEAAGQHGARTPRLPWRRRLWEALPAARGLTLAGGIASMAAVALAVWSFAIPHGGGPAAPTVLVSRACGLTTMPSACGELTYTASAHQTVLTIQGLPALAQPSDRTAAAYAVWLLHGGAPRLGGYLTEAPDGRTWTAVLEGDSSSYDAIATTREPRVGGQVPTGPELLRIGRPEAPAQS
ncbi:MAG TPA: anti-sigma factor [Candidatus Dormibacteraeota bacterium]|nr:anti-sigma factor [Candidatus Dormibacteraeota bacterium]